VTDLLGLIAASFGVVMALSPALQIRRVLARRSSADVSVAYLAVLEVGFALWFAYGAALGNLAIVIPNLVAFTVGLATLVVVVRFRIGSSAARTD
jgi:MtN3 and saliva related transmembrane protein